MDVFGYLNVPRIKLETVPFRINRLEVIQIIKSAAVLPRADSNHLSVLETTKASTFKKETTKATIIITMTIIIKGR